MASQPFGGGGHKNILVEEAEGTEGSEGAERA